MRQEVEAAPRGLQRLEVGMVEDLAQELARRGIDARDQLGLAGVAAGNAVRGGDPLQEDIPGTLLARPGTGPGHVGRLGEDLVEQIRGSGRRWRRLDWFLRFRTG